MNAQHSRVMFVDDEEGVRLSWSRYLSARGFDVTTVEDGEGAINRLAKEPVDVVISDLRMPGVNGLQLLEWMHGHTPDTKFVLFTGYGSEEVEKQARALGAFEYLNKPVSPETLSAVITAAIHMNLLPELTEEKAVAPAQAQALDTELTPALEQTTALPKKRTPKDYAKIGVGLVSAPLLGLAFVMFLPVIGFGMLFWVLAQAIRGRHAAPAKA